MTQPATPSDDLAEKLGVEEYKSCRDLISKNIDIVEKTEVYAIGAAAASAAFCLTHLKDTVVRDASAILPLAVSVVGLLRYVGVDRTISKINRYLRLVELRHKRHIGWSRYYKRVNKIKWLKGSR